MGLPVIEGGVLFCGAAAVDTTSLGFEFTGPVEPSLFDAVTRTIIVLPASVGVSVYEALRSRAILAQFAPRSSQRSHWYEKLVGVFDQQPVVALIVLPTTSFPSICGAHRFTGAANDRGEAPEAKIMATAIMSVRTPTTRPVFGLLAGVFIIIPHVWTIGIRFASALRRQTPLLFESRKKPPYSPGVRRFALALVVTILAISGTALAAIPKNTRFKGKETASYLVTGKDGRSVAQLKLASPRTPAACRLKNPILTNLKVSPAGTFAFKGSVPTASGKKISLKVTGSFLTDYLANITALYSGPGCSFAFSDALAK